MAASKLNPKNLTIGILGYTGESGKAVAHEVLKNSIFANVILIGRRQVEYQEDFYKNATQKVVDFEKLSSYEDVFQGLDIVYCCLGTTRGKAGAEGFRRVDFDYIVESAKLAKQTGCKQFHLVSSTGADKNSSFLYPKTKGEAEEAVSNLGFDKCASYRPALLLCDRKESRPAEAIARFLSKPFAYFVPSFGTTPVETLAKAMINNTINHPDTPKVEVLSNAQIFKLASEQI